MAIWELLHHDSDGAITHKRFLLFDMDSYRMDIGSVVVCALICYIRFPYPKGINVCQM